MVKYITAKELRLEFPKVVKKVKNGVTLIVFKRSNPVFKILPISEEAEGIESRDLLSAVSKNPCPSPSLDEINKIVHKLRRK